MDRKIRLLATIVAGLLLSTVALPATASAAHDEDHDQTFYECLKTGWIVTYCLEETGLADTTGDEQSFYECLKTGWIVTYCLEKAGVPPS